MPKNPTPMHIIFHYRKSETKKKILKEARGRKHLIYKGTITTNFSESMQARREWSEVFKVLRETKQKQTPT